MPSSPAHRGSRPRHGVFLNSTSLAERKAALHVLETQRDAVLHHLNSLLTQKQGQREQDTERRALVHSLCSNGERAEQAAARLQRGKRRVERCKARQANRRAQLEALCEQLRKERLRSVTYLFPNDLRTHEMALLHTRLGLAADQRHKLRQLLDVLPLTVTGMGKSYPVAHDALGGTNGSGIGQGGVSIAICGLRLPERIAVDTLQQEPAQLALSASLGYMLLLSELLAAYIGGPMLHEGSFQGSTTVVWQQQSFWDRRPASSSDVLPLFVEKGLSMLGAALGAATGTTAEAQTTKSSSSGWGPLSLLRRVSSIPSPPGPPSPTSLARPSGLGAQSNSPGVQQQWQQQWQWQQWPHRQGHGVEAEAHAHAQAKHANLDLAFNMLQRSASSLVHDKAHDLGLSLPSSWGPFGWLVMLCAALVQDDNCPHSRLGGVLSAAAGCVASEQQAALLERQRQAAAHQHYHWHRAQQEAHARERQQRHPRQRSGQQLEQGSSAQSLPAHRHQQQHNQSTEHAGPDRSDSITADIPVLVAPPGLSVTLQGGNTASTPKGSSTAQGATTPAGTSPPHPDTTTHPQAPTHAPQQQSATSQHLPSQAATTAQASQSQHATHSQHNAGGPREGHTQHAQQAAVHVQRAQHGGGGEEEEENGWEEVDRHHILPPPPSADEDVLQYVRALYGDGNKADRPSRDPGKGTS